MLAGSLRIAAIAGLAVLQAQMATAAEIKVLSIPLQSSLDEIGRQLESATGHKLVVKYAPAAPLRKQIDSGEAFDAVIIFPSQIDELIKQGKVVAGTRVDFARAGLGLVVRKGAIKPDITSVDAFKRALLNARSIAYAAQGPSGIHFVGLLDRLGIAAEIQPRLKAMAAGSLVVGPVAKGDIDIGIVSIPFILADPGAELAGPLPRELQDYVLYSAGIGADSTNAQAAKAFVSFLGQPGPASTMRSNGLEPVATP